MNKALFFNSVTLAVISIYMPIAQGMAYLTQTPSQVHTYVRDMNTGVIQDYVGQTSKLGFYDAPVTAYSLFLPAVAMLIVVSIVLMVLGAMAKKDQNEMASTTAASGNTDDLQDSDAPAHGEQQL